MIKLARKNSIWYTTVTILGNPVTVPFINSRDAIKWAYAYVSRETM